MWQRILGLSNQDKAEFRYFKFKMPFSERSVVRKGSYLPGRLHDERMNLLPRKCQSIRSKFMSHSGTCYTPDTGCVIDLPEFKPFADIWRYRIAVVWQWTVWLAREMYWSRGHLRRCCRSFENGGLKRCWSQCSNSHTWLAAASLSDIEMEDIGGWQETGRLEQNLHDQRVNFLRKISIESPHERVSVGIYHKRSHLTSKVSRRRPGIHFFSNVQKDFAMPPRKYVDGNVCESGPAESSYGITEQCLASVRVVACPVARNQR